MCDLFGKLGYLINPTVHGLDQVNNNKNCCQDWDENMSNAMTNTQK